MPRLSVKKSLPHSGVEHSEQAVKAALHHFVHIGQKIKANAGFRSRKRDRAPYQSEHEDQQTEHHVFDNTLNPVAHSHAAHHKTNSDSAGHPKDHGVWITQHGLEKFGDLSGAAPGEFATSDIPAVRHHPAGDSRIEHHQHITSDQAEAAEHMPLASFWLQSVKGCPHVFS